MVYINLLFKIVKSVIKTGDGKIISLNDPQLVVFLPYNRWKPSKLRILGILIDTLFEILTDEWQISAM